MTPSPQGDAVLSRYLTTRELAEELRYVGANAQNSAQKFISATACVATGAAVAC